MRCDWELLAEEGLRRQYVCPRCGTKTALTLVAPQNIHSQCKDGLGDYVAGGLSAFGITRARVTWVAGLFGGKGCGGCPERQEALNEAGKKIGL